MSTKNYKQELHLPYPEQVFITDENFMKNKNLSDLVYGYMRIRSFATPGSAETNTYCFKSNITADKIIKYYQEETKENCPYSRNTIRRYIKLLLDSAWVDEIDYEGKPAYLLSQPGKGKFVLIRLETYKYLVDTATPNVIKIYAYLKDKMRVHNWIKGHKNKDIPKYCFTKAELIDAIGYTVKGGSKNAQNHYRAITNILNCLVSFGLIEIHEENRPVNNNISAHYFVLDDVKEDYIHYISSKAKKTDEEISIPVPEASSENNIYSKIYDEEKDKILNFNLE